MFNRSPDFSGMIHVTNEDLIESCKRKIERNQVRKARYKRRMINCKMNEMIWWWNNLYRFFYLPKPTRAKAEEKAFASWQDQASLDLIGAMTVEKCKKMINAAERNPDEKMWITVDVALTCGFLKQ